MLSPTKKLSLNKMPNPDTGAFETFGNESRGPSESGKKRKMVMKHISENSNIKSHSS
jgi:hypothetical protein